MNKKILLFMCLFSLIKPAAPQSFVAKKKKTISTSTLKNNCCTSGTNLLTSSAELIEHLAQYQLKLDKKNTQLISIIENLSKIQQCMLVKIRSILEGSSNCFFAQATKKQLLDYDNTTITCNNTLTAATKKLQRKTLNANEIEALAQHVNDYCTYLKNI